MGNSKLTESGLSIAKARYFFEDVDKDWEDVSNRVANEIVRPENGNVHLYRDKFAQMIYDMDFLPGGRILRNAGRQRGSLFNCYVIPIGDSIEEIGQFLKDSLTLWSEGGGVGTNLSYLRPRGAAIKGKGGSSSGPISFLEAADAVASTIECIDGLSMITTDHGLKYIKDITTTDKVLTRDGYCLVNKTLSKVDSIFNMGLSNGTFINATKNHKFWSYSNGTTGWTTLDDLNVNDWMALPVGGFKGNMQNLDNVEVEHFNENDIVLPTVLDKSFGLWLGLMFGDGSMSSSKSLFNLQIDDSYVDLFSTYEKLVAHLFNVTTFNSKRNDKIDNSTGVRFSSRKLERFLRVNGLWKDQVKIPDKIKSSDIEVVYSFISGLFEADGHVHVDGYPCLTSAYYEFLNELSVLLFSIGLPNTINVNSSRENSFNQKEIYTLTILTEEGMDLFINKIGFISAKKQQVLVERNKDTRKFEKSWFIPNLENEFLNANFKGEDRRRLSNFTDKRKRKGLTKFRCKKLMTDYYDSYKGTFIDASSNTNLYWVQVKNKSFFKEDVVYDLNINNTHEYIANGLLVHNSGGQRRAAGMACMNATHPDILEFIDAKIIHGKIPHFNISVLVDDEFLDAVEANKEWDFKFASRGYGSVKARDIWDKVIENMVKDAEPGLLHWDNMRSNNSYYYDPVIGSNPCGEAILSPYDVCNLGSLVLPNFITGTVNTNWKKLEEIIRLAIRFLDDVIDVNKYILTQNELKAHSSRRLGLGVMGVAEYLFAKKLRYGSKKAIDEIEKLMRFIRDTAYQASMELAVEKGSFPKFDSAGYSKAHFVRSLPAQLRMEIKDKGIRNVTCLALAPTGTISLLPEVTSGVEPLFMKAYLRKDRVSERMYVHPQFKQLLEFGGEVPEWFVDTTDLTPADHFETQVVVQKYVDGAVSKTVNMPKNTTPEQLSRLTLEYIRDLKGVTVYVDGSREGQILNSVSLEEIKHYLKEAKDTKSSADTETTKCHSGSCEI